MTRRDSPQKPLPIRPTPGFLTGTSSEFTGRRALPHILRERFVIIVVGPKGAGKSKVAAHLAGSSALILERRRMDELLVSHMRHRRWPPNILNAPALVIDGVVWLETRTALLNALAELARLRTEAARRTYICQRDDDGSVNLLLDHMEPGSTVLLGLRFPMSRRGRLRFATRVCEQNKYNKKLAQRTVDLEPWGYAAVIGCLEALHQAEIAENEGGSVPKTGVYSATLPPPT